MRNLKQNKGIIVSLLYIFIVSILFIILAVTKRLESLLYEPLVSPTNWCDNQPCLDLGFFIINQPTSSILVYLASIIPIYVGIYFIRYQNKQNSRLWWGLALILVGIGAGLAGTSYQAFGFEIKCKGNEFCLWTSWWEIAYEISTILGANALLIAISYSMIKRKWIRKIRIFSIIHVIGYTILVFYGAFLPNRFIISFEMMLLFVLPIYALVVSIAIYNYIKSRTTPLLKLLGGCILLFAAIGIYYVYSLMGVTQALWSNGIWFSDNDVLHILMIVWIVYIKIVMERDVKDLEIKENLNP